MVYSERLFQRIADPNDPFGNLDEPPARPLPGAPAGSSGDGPLFNPDAPARPSRRMTEQVDPSGYPPQGEYNPAFDGLEDDGESPEVWVRSPEGSMHRRRREDVQSLPPGWTRAPMIEPEVVIRTPEGAHFRVPRSKVGTGEGQWPPELVVPTEAAPNAARLYAPPARRQPRPQTPSPVQPGFNGNYEIPQRPLPAQSSDPRGEGPLPASPGQGLPGSILPGSETQYWPTDPDPYPKPPPRRRQSLIERYRARYGEDPTPEELAQIQRLEGA